MIIKKIHEIWSINDNENKIIITLRPDNTYDIFRNHVIDEKFIDKAIKKLISKL
jgi:hypothetical protein